MATVDSDNMKQHILLYLQCISFESTKWILKHKIVTPIFSFHTAVARLLLMSIQSTHPPMLQIFKQWLNLTHSS